MSQHSLSAQSQPGDLSHPQSSGLTTSAGPQSLLVYHPARSGRLVRSRGRERTPPNAARSEVRSLRLPGFWLSACSPPPPPTLSPSLPDTFFRIEKVRK